MALKPFRLRVLEALSAAMREITLHNGYAHDLSEGVYRGRLYFDASTPLPALSILENADPDDPLAAPTGSPIVAGTYQLILQGWVEDDKINPTDPAHFLAADVIKKLAELKLMADEPNRVFGFGTKAPTVEALAFGSPIVRPPDDISSKAYFWINVGLDLIEKHDDPYA